MVAIDWRLRLDALAGGIALTAAALSTRHPAPLAVLFVAGVAFMPRPRWPLLALAATGVLMNGLFSWYGATELWRAPFTLGALGRPRITVEALIAGGVVGMQIAVAAAGITIAWARTPAQAVARFVPGAGPRLAMRLGLRAVPDLAQDARAMRQALSLRGTGDRARDQAGLLVPLVARSLDRSAATVETLYARGAGARPRPVATLHLGARGIVATVAGAVVIALAILGHGPMVDLLPRYQASPLDAWQTWTPLLALAALPALEVR